MENPTDNPILTALVHNLREETGIDVTCTLEGGKFYVSVGSHWGGPMDHPQAWYHLVGIYAGATVSPTLDTEKRRKDRVVRDALKKVQDITAEKAAE